MKPFSFASLAALPLLLIGVAACGSDDGDGPTGATGPTGPFDLTFTGDASFQTAHGGQEILVLVESAAGEVVAFETAVVSESADPSFSFQFQDVLQEGRDYAVKYWIDSNFGGGTVGVCDPPSNDHQWRLEVTGVDDDVSLTDAHRPGETEAVCDAFSFDLAFTGDATFQTAHGGQTVNVSVIRSSSGVSGGELVVATATGTVSSSEDPTFSFDFPGVLTRGMEYHLDYWIDSNFGGGTEGTCDPPENDHQWRIDFGPVTEAVTIADQHRPGEVESICSGGSGDGGTGDGQDGGGGGGDDTNY